jgi:rhodanese-related sulfurtransferase
MLKRLTRWAGLKVRIGVQALKRFESLRAGLAFAAAMALLQPALADNDAGLPAALKGVQRADGQCRRDPQRAASGIESAGPRHWRADLSCAIPATEVAALLNKPDTVLIDVRTAADFQAFHIADAINVDASVVKSKAFWRSKQVVLMGSGKSEGELYAACTELKSRGFAKARVLRGGLAGWLGAGQTVAGHPPPLAEMVQLSAIELWQESRFVDNVVLQSAARTDMADPLAAPVVVPQTTASVIRQVLARRAIEMKNAPFAALIIVAEQAMTPAAQAALVHDLLPLPVLIYSDSATAYLKQMAVQEKVWTAHARGPKQPPGCGG